LGCFAGEATERANFVVAKQLLDYSKPFFKRDDQTLRLGSKLENKKLKAFASKEASMSGYLERELSSEAAASLVAGWSRNEIFSCNCQEI